MVQPPHDYDECGGSYMMPNRINSTGICQENEMEPERASSTVKDTVLEAAVPTGAQVEGAAPHRERRCNSGANRDTCEARVFRPPFHNELPISKVETTINCRRGIYRATRNV